MIAHANSRTQHDRVAWVKASCGDGKQLKSVLGAAGGGAGYPGRDLHLHRARLRRVRLRAPRHVVHRHRPRAGMHPSPLAQQTAGRECLSLQSSNCCQEWLFIVGSHLLSVRKSPELPYALPAVRFACQTGIVATILCCASCSLRICFCHCSRMQEETFVPL